jgi:hypothetical protein
MKEYTGLVIHYKEQNKTVVFLDAPASELHGKKVRVTIEERQD